ncbi:hypothetical protein PR202_gb23328 [Eleusine coracana subsp. coracana]|uniref:Uncharacterized protein n=1 Tax=Eleusine coracana subsp. coracana TaxID=191504 RepID=A0AAV5FHY7_ELECO|nr:hypothetical protein PR202_gb23328 [Eleusine coracana subsp. coracana]
MNAYCDRQSVDMKAIIFLFDGRRLNSEQIPDQVCGAPYHALSHNMYIFFMKQNNSCEYVSQPCTLVQQFQLEMEDGDEIDAMLH